MAQVIVIITAEYKEFFPENDIERGITEFKVCVDEEMLEYGDKEDFDAVFKELVKSEEHEFLKLGYLTYSVQTNIPKDLTSKFEEVWNK